MLYENTEHLENPQVHTLYIYLDETLLRLWYQLVHVRSSTVQPQSLASYYEINCPFATRKKIAFSLEKGILASMISLASEKAYFLSRFSTCSIIHYIQFIHKLRLVKLLRASHR